MVNESSSEWSKINSESSGASTGAATSKRSSIFELANHASLQWARHDSLENLRHQSDFETLGMLGKGAFGVTFKVKNRVDGKIYTLKRVYLGKAEDDARKVLREVEVLSSLNSENVVRYYAAWVEKGSEAAFSICDESDCSEYSSWSDSVSAGATASGNLDTSSVDPVCHLCQTAYKDWEVSFEQWGLIDAVLQPKFLCIDCYKASLPNEVDASTIRIRETMPFFLFILMEYCETTMQETIESIHTRSSPSFSERGYSTENQQSVNHRDQLLWKYFADCVQGLEHCHSLNFIHRDIKTSNIFVHKGVAKLGDLGLATQKNNQYATLNVSMSQDESDGKNNHLQSQPAYVLGQNVSLSSKVGTFLYAAPEVNSGDTYDEKCDVFSLGVVLVEMWCRFNTAMERADVLQRLRLGQFPPALAKENPLIEKLAREMLALESSSRPSCSQILALLLQEGVWVQKHPVHLEQLVEDLRCSREKLLHDLDRKDGTIRKLRELLDSNNIPNDHII